MPDSSRPDHDQRLKVLLKEFFEPFLRCFFPELAARLRFDEIDWLDKEVFLSPPQGDRRVLDLVARLKVRPDAHAAGSEATELVALVHVEIESRDSISGFGQRMFDYYVQLRRDTGLTVLPIAVFLRVGLDGIGWGVHDEHFGNNRIVRFEYAYVGLPALDGAQYATGENLVGAALSSLMRRPADDRLELYAEALKRIATAPENDFRRFLLSECLEAYAELDEVQKQRLTGLLDTEAYQEVPPLMKTTYERGIEYGMEQGIARGVEQGIEQGLVRGITQGEIRSTLRQLQAKFGPLPPDVKALIETLSPEQNAQLQIDLLEARSLEELNLAR